MSLLKSFGSLNIARSYVTKSSTKAKKFTSILDNVPVRPRNAWSVYLRENMTQYRTEKGTVDLKTATKQLSIKWNALSDQEKDPFAKIYKKEADEHNKQLEAALNNATPKQFAEENALRKKYKLTLLKDPRQPKRPKNNFLFYLEDMRAKNDPIFKDPKVSNQVINAAKKYKELSPSQLKVYADRSKAAAEQYKKDSEAYLQSTE